MHILYKFASAARFQKLIKLVSMILILKTMRLVYENVAINIIKAVASTFCSG